jgi:hypothetical protein
MQLLICGENLRNKFESLSKVMPRNISVKMIYDDTYESP